MAEQLVVRVPKTRRSSFDPNRPLTKNVLLQTQVKHFRHVEEKLPLAEQTGIDIARLATEGQAADYIRRVTQKLHARAKD
ncbi:MAG TPA: hypothetical protein VMI94_10190 [Bryobacteraceae bacterium]|nr:hypothetical protein [Bryobacteraceae bacterium]